MLREERVAEVVQVDKLSLSLTHECSRERSAALRRQKSSEVEAKPMAAANLDAWELMVIFINCVIVRGTSMLQSPAPVGANSALDVRATEICLVTRRW